MKASAEVASAVAAQMRFTPVRTTSSLLDDSKKPELSEDTVVALADLLEQAKQLDGLKKANQAKKAKLQRSSSIENLSFLKSSSSGSLSSGQEPQPSPSQATQLPLQAEKCKFPVPNQPSRLQVAPVPDIKPAKEIPRSDVEENPTIPPAAGMTLEEVEDNAFEVLSNKNKPKKKPGPPAAKKKAGSKGKGKGKGKGMKRPCASTKAVQKATIEKKAHQPEQKPEEKKRATCWGCTRCRGNVHGCDGCAFDGFRGVRLNGRAAWQAYKQAQTRKGK